MLLSELLLLSLSTSFNRRTCEERAQTLSTLHQTLSTLGPTMPALLQQIHQQLTGNIVLKEFGDELLLVYIDEPDEHIRV